MEATTLTPNKTQRDEREPRQPVVRAVTLPQRVEPPPFVRLLIPALLILAAAIPFLFSLRSEFVYDDDVQIVHNIAIRTWSGVSAYIVPTAISQDAHAPINGNYYRPLFFIWLHLNYSLFGLNPTAWHVAGLILHLGVTLLVFALIRRHLESAAAKFSPQPTSPAQASASQTQVLLLAAAGALIFAIHPVHVESVVWVSGATDSLAAMGLLGSLLLWMPSEAADTKRPRPLRSIASLACYAAALLAKETAIVLPAIIFVYAFWQVGEPLNANQEKSARAWPALRGTIPFVAVSAAYFAARLAVLHGFRSGTPWISLKDALLTIPRVLAFYTRHLVWPAHLSLFYDLKPVSSALSTGFLLPSLLLVAIAASGLLCWRARRDNLIPVAFAWLLIPLVPVLDIALFQREDFAHDRYLYLPAIGLAMLCAALLQSLMKSLQRSSLATSPTGSRVLLAGLTVFFCILATSTAVQAQYWRDDLALYTHAMERSRNTGARNNLASLYAKLGRIDEAEAMLAPLALEQPDSWLVNYNLGYVNYQKKNFDLAERYLRRAVTLDPSDAGQYTYLGLIYFRQSRYTDAATQLRLAIARDPAAEGDHLALGLVLERMGDLKAAKSELLLEMKYHPGAVAALQINRINKVISAASLSN